MNENNQEPPEGFFWEERSSVRESKKAKKPTFHDMQKVNNEKTPLKPYEAYNKFIRKQGEPVLTEEEYIEKLKLEEAFKLKLD